MLLECWALAGLLPRVFGHSVAWLDAGAIALKTRTARILSPILCGYRFRSWCRIFLGGYSMAHPAQQVMHRLRRELGGKLVALPASSSTVRPAGVWFPKVTHDVQQNAQPVKRSLVAFGRLTVIFYLVQLFLIDWQLTLTFLIIAPLVGGIVSGVQILPALQLTNARFDGRSHSNHQ